MFKDLNDFKNYIKGKHAAVIGVGISNKPLIKYIVSLGAEVTAFDIADADDPNILSAQNEFARSGIDLSWSLGKDYLDKLHGFDIIFKTPKMRMDAIWDGGIVTSEMEVFFDCCPCRTIGITGSDGKTTTTTIIAKILEQDGYKVHLGGNIGTPLIDRLDDIVPEDIAVVELSSFQLSTMVKSPDIALITNITPNHLDFHISFEEYIDAKKNIFLHQNPGDILVLNAEDPVSSVFSLESRGEVRFFPGKMISDKDSAVKYEAFYDDTRFYLKSGRSVNLSEIKLSGRHNHNNYCSAVTVLRDLVTDEAILSVLKTFEGVNHRNEYIRTLDGVEYYNSSIDSSPTRTIATLQGYIDKGQRTIVIAGGKDKNCDYSGLGDKILEAADTVILCGDNASLIKTSIENAILHNAQRKITIHEADDHTRALAIARDCAKPGDAVIFTPAGTSFDRFRNFEERGDHFRKLVREL